MKTFRTILNIKEQKDYSLGADAILIHKWSARGMGNSKLINNVNIVVGKASGCGYDRWGACLADFISKRFAAELQKLAKKTVKGKAYKYSGFTPCPAFYGMRYNRKTGEVALDGGCGSSCMENILNAIGFRLRFAGETAQTNSGAVHYVLEPFGKGSVTVYGV